MKKLLTLGIILFFIGTTTKVFTNQSAPPLGNTNAPGNGNCSSCHGSTITSGTVWSGMSLTTSVSLASMQPSTTYIMNLTFSDVSSTKYGFQLLALPGSANGSTNSIGTIVPGVGNTSVQTGSASGRTYAMHTSSGTAAPNNTKTWNFNFTTPASASNGVVFYVAINSTDGDFSAGPDDYIYLKTFSATVLPVKWLDVSALVQTKNVLINWSTAQEINNQTFEIEKSTDNNNWQTIGLVKGAGNSSKINNYSFLDFELPILTTFYRIKQIDVDGKYSYSAVFSVEPNKKAEEWHFNTANNTVYFTSNTQKELAVFNQNGTLVYQTNTNNLELNLNHLSKGIYFVKIWGIEPNSLVKKVMVN